MKLKSLSYLIVFALALTVAATGCKKKPTPITKLPPGRTGVGDPGASGLPSGGTYNPADNPGGLINTAGLEDFGDMVGDRAALSTQTLYFDFDSSVVKSSEQSKVTAVAQALQADAAAKLLVEGHCDERGTEEYNRALGERRALAIRTALADAGIDPDRIRTISYGKDRRVAFNDDEASHRLNRRGEFVLLHPKP